jgi:alkanesulfonate monooxygenase SsuD/methylene tetrahydromethanopterin reductase-like flavin-dependent oxidoreductase (luciferase family)
MLIGISMPLPAYTIDPAFMARNAERLGFDSIWYAEHPAVPVESASPFPATGGAIPWTYSHFTDPYIALARASAVTTKLELGTGITLVPQRNPLLLAKEIAALDLHSGGRFIFGIGTGWLSAGADRVVVRATHVETEAEMGAQLERMAEAVLGRR